ncbi:hypothetical protein PC117_g24584 [Phytophthora cactorum]|uniref:Uncharacterized protein n=1 Tax=Phytophthora cactorum TaxID=29920 RepID=A0A8T1AXM2_9STRA|nr:hypothetical protein PC117_g24584 [Phytophthora cactorum]
MACCKTLTEVKNIIWHGCFTLDLPQMRAWIGADLAALPQTSGGMAVPDLRTELIAMTGSGTCITGVAMIEGVSSV